MNKSAKQKEKTYGVTPQQYETNMKYRSKWNELNSPEMHVVPLACSIFYRLE